MALLRPASGGIERAILSRAPEARLGFGQTVASRIRDMLQTIWHTGKSAMYWTKRATCIKYYLVNVNALCQIAGNVRSLGTSRE